MAGELLTDTAPDPRWVRVWFVATNEHNTDTLVASYRATSKTVAEQYRAAMRDQRGIRVSIDPMPPSAPPTRELPAEQLWALTP
jgi:hypothetical protein